METKLNKLIKLVAKYFLYNHFKYRILTHSIDLSWQSYFYHVLRFLEPNLWQHLINIFKDQILLSYVKKNEKSIYLAILNYNDSFGSVTR
jgi:hypothetical protein